MSCTLFTPAASCQDGRSEMAVAEAEATNSGEPILHARALPEPFFMQFAADEYLHCAQLAIYAGLVGEQANAFVSSPSEQHWPA